MVPVMMLLLLAAVTAGTTAQVSNGAAERDPLQHLTPGPRAVEEGAELSSERSQNEEGGACVMSGGEMYELISMCHERGWTFSPDLEACAGDRQVLLEDQGRGEAETEGATTTGAPVSGSVLGGDVCNTARVSAKPCFPRAYGTQRAKRNRRV